MKPKKIIFTHFWMHKCMKFSEIPTTIITFPTVWNNLEVKKSYNTYCLFIINFELLTFFSSKIYNLSFGCNFQWEGDSEFIHFYICFFKIFQIFRKSISKRTCFELLLPQELYIVVRIAQIHVKTTTNQVLFNFVFYIHTL